MREPALIAVVDDDESVRESLPELLRQLGFGSETFASAEAFLASNAISRTSCVILDVAMPGMSGPDLQDELNRRRHEVPIVFITASRDKAIGERLVERGAVKCLLKPFSELALLDALTMALRKG